MFMKTKVLRQANGMSRYLIISAVLLIYLLGFNNAGAQSTDWMKDITHEAGLDYARGSRVLVIDINNDNYPDLMWGTGNANQNHYYLMLNVADEANPGKRKFIDFTKESGINKSRDTSHAERVIDIAAFADVDNDGDLDVVTSIYYHRWEYISNILDTYTDRSEVLLNDGSGHFTLLDNNGLTNIVADPDRPVGIINSTGLSFLDFDLDGNIDLYISTWFSDYKANLDHNGNGYVMPDVLLRGNGDGTFTKVENNGVQSVEMPEYGVNVTDWNNDGWQDIFTCAYCRSGGNLYMNNQDGTFSDVAATANYSGQIMAGDNGQALCNWEAIPADFDNDGDMDFLQVQVHGGYDNKEGRTHVTINEGPDSNYKLEWAVDRLRRKAPSNSHVSDQGGEWFDLNGDARLDIALGQMGYPAPNTQGQERLYICLQNDTAYFDDITTALGLFNLKEGHSPEPGDFDLDGDQDLFISRQIRDTTVKDTVIDGKDTTLKIISNYMLVTLLRNDIGNKNNWVSVKLDAPQGCNKAAIGARVRVFSDGVAQIREIQGGLGHFANMQPFIMNFGLKDKNRIDSVVVTWPMKQNNKTTVYNPPMNSVIEIGQSGLKPGLVKNWTGTKPVIAVSKPYVGYAKVPAGTTQESSIDISNIGDAPLTLSGLKLTGNNTTFYSLVNNLDGTTLQPGESKTLNVNFAPNKRLVYKSTIEVKSNAFNQPVKNIDIIGNGYEPAPVISLNSTDFRWDSLFIGSNAKRTLKITNSGDQDLVVSDINFKDNGQNVFSFSGNNKDITIQSGKSYDLEITYTPVAGKKWESPDTYKGTIVVTSNGYNSETGEKLTVSEVSLTGYTNGPAPELAISSKSLIMGNAYIDSTVVKNVIISNPGNSPLTVFSIVEEDDTLNAFSLDVTTPFELPAHGSKTIEVTFTPHAVQSYNCAVTVSSNAYTDSVKVFRIKGNCPIQDVIDYVDDGSVQVVPNPATDNADIVFNVPMDVLSIDIVDILGNTVKSINDPSVIGETGRLTLDLSTIANGSYMIVIRQNRFSKIIPLKVIK